MAELQRKLSTFDLTMIAIGSMIGSGVFLTPSIVAQNLPSPLWMLAAWALGGILAMSCALSLTELGGMFPSAGGMYVYLTKAFGRQTGFLFGWAYFAVVNTGGIAALSIAFAAFIGAFVELSPLETQIVALSGLAVLTIMNVLGIRFGKVFSDTFSLLKLAGIAVLILVGFSMGSPDNVTSVPGSMPESMSGAFAAAMVGVLWAYGGAQHASFTAGEAKNPTKSVPLAILLGTMTVTTVYLLANAAYLFLLPIPEIASSTRLAADAMRSALGPTGERIMAFAIFISILGTLGIFTLTAPRIYFAMANDGLFFRRVAEIHPRFQTPAFAIIVQSAWAAVLILFWGTFNELISYVVFVDWVFFGLTGAAVFVLRRTMPDTPRPYKTFGYPVTPAIFVGSSLWFVINTLIDKPMQAIAGLIFLGVGMVIYRYWDKRNPRSGIQDSGSV